ncbi:hypothetical protein I4U23_018066 [Adineta vaga]|nr:hypothetical protein I4U23_018066 [Adineta vaga]
MLKQINRSEPALHINEIDVNDKYKFLKLIGKGSYGEVWLVLPLRQSASSSSNKSNTKQHVLKRLDLRQQSSDTTQNDIEGAEREAKLLSTLKHPNIVAYIESFRSNDGFLNIMPQTSEIYSDSLTAIIKSMLSKKPMDRPTAKKILQNPFIKRHIIQLLEKTKVKCQNQVNSNSQITVVALPVPPSPPPPPSSPPRLSSSNDAKKPHSSANSPSSKNSQPNRLSNNNTPVLPSYPPLPPSHNRPSNNITSSSSGSSSSADASRSLPSVDVNQSNNARARRRLRVRQSNPLPINDHKMDLNYLSRLSENDTLQRRKRDQQINNHLKQHQQISSDDEHEISSSPKPSQQVVVVPQKQLVRPSSAASSVESNHSKFSFDDDVYSYDRHSNLPYHHHHHQAQQQQQSESKIVKSYDSNNNSNARQRRRDSRIQSSIESSYSIMTNNDNQDASRSTSQDMISAEIEKKKEGEKDMNDLLFMLTATLKLAPVTVTDVQDSDMDSSQLTNSSNDSDKTLVDNGYDDSPSQEQISQPWSPGDRTIEVPLHQTNRLQKRCEALKADCLRDISEEKLRRVLNILENVSEAQMTQEIILELGYSLYTKYASQIFLLKFYEDSLRTHT